MPKVKLGKKAFSFSDPMSGLTLAGNEIKDLPRGPHSWVLKGAIRGGHVEVIYEEPTPEPEPTREENLKLLTRNELMDAFSFIDSDHKAEADKLKTKAEVLSFLLSIEEDYVE